MAFACLFSFAYFSAPLQRFFSSFFYHFQFIFLFCIRIHFVSPFLFLALFLLCFFNFSLVIYSFTYYLPSYYFILSSLIPVLPPAHGLINYVGTKAKCRHQKNCPVKAGVYLPEAPSPPTHHPHPRPATHCLNMMLLHNVKQHNVDVT